MRVIDDVVDDDIADMLLEQRIMFTDAIIKLLEQKNLTKEEADLIGVTKVMWEEIERHVGLVDSEKTILSGCLKIVASMKYDMDRITGEFPFQSESDLKQHFHMLDIEGTIGPTAAILGLSPQESLAMLTPLGEASRIAYNLRDLQEDVSKRLYNISIEEMSEFGIQYSQDGTLLRSAGLRMWIAEQKRQMIQKMFETRNRLREERISLSYSDSGVLREGYNFILRKIILPKMYEKEIYSVHSLAIEGTTSSFLVVNL